MFRSSPKFIDKLRKILNKDFRTMNELVKESYKDMSKEEFANK